jgi:hypothetical protein
MATMHVSALFDKGRRDAIRGAVASRDLGPVLKKRAEPFDTPNPLSVFIPKSPGVPMEEAIRQADEAGVVIASNKVIDSVLYSDQVESIKSVFPCWTGTMAGYVEQGRTFREAGEWSDTLKSHAIVYVDDETKIRYLLPIPEEHLDKKDSILVVNHPLFSLETNGNDRIVRAAQVSLIERFPAQDGRYQADPQFGIPYDAPASCLGGIPKLLFRGEKWVGLATRGSCDDDFHYLRFVIILCAIASNCHGVAVDRQEAEK